MSERLRVDKVISLTTMHDEAIPGLTARLVLNQAVRELADGSAKQMERIVADHLLDYVRITAKKNVRVDIRRPRWMPERLHRWLMRQIVVVESPTIVETR